VAGQLRVHDDREEFLAGPGHHLFDPKSAADRWIGTVTTLVDSARIHRPHSAVGVNMETEMLCELR
jgi:hypothetical protein